MKRLIATLTLVLLAGSFAATARAGGPSLQGEGEGLELIANVSYPGGSDMEFLSRKGRDYAITGSYGNTGAMRVIDITKPPKPKVVATLPCNLTQNDVQISHDGKTVMLASDPAGGPQSCLGIGKRGFMTVDISNIKRPKPIGFAENPSGSHNTTAHPTKPYVYNSSSGEIPGIVHIWSIKNPAKPKLVNTYTLLGASAPHDISFNSNGTRAVLAGGGKNVELLDTTDPENPVFLTKTLCAGCSLSHDAKFTPDDRYVIVGDEAAGGGTFACPGGALYFYELQGSEDQPLFVLIGVYEPNEVLFATGTQLGSCTSHVMDLSDDGKHLAVSWYTAGTRYLDISNMAGATFGDTGNGVREVGWFIPEDGDSWASKFYKGPYIYSNDINRGFDVYRITAGD